MKWDHSTSLSFVNRHNDSPSQIGLGDLASRVQREASHPWALLGREGWNDASDLQLQWWKYRSVHHRDSFQGWVKLPLTVSLLWQFRSEGKRQSRVVLLHLPSGLWGQMASVVMVFVVVSEKGRGHGWTSVIEKQSIKGERRAVKHWIRYWQNPICWVKLTASHCVRKQGWKQNSQGSWGETLLQGTRGFWNEKQLARKYDFSPCRETGGGSLLAVVRWSGSRMPWPRLASAQTPGPRSQT